MKRILIVLGVVIILLAAFWGFKAMAPTAPVADTYEGWVPASSLELSYKYPEILGTSYISTAEWPPLVDKVVNSYSCATGPAAVDGAPTAAEERVINGRTYCVSVSSEGAAGSTYRSFDYATDLGDKVVRTYFTLRYPQCANYDEPKQSECKQEQSSFNVDALADRIISSVQ